MESKGVPNFKIVYYNLESIIPWSPDSIARFLVKRLERRFNLSSDLIYIKECIRIGLNRTDDMRKCEAYVMPNCEAYVMPYRIRVFEIYEITPISHDKGYYEVRVPKCISGKFYEPIEDLREWLRG